MRKLLYILAAVAALSSCCIDNTAEILLPGSDTETPAATPAGRTRSYEEALEIARQSIDIIDGPEATRADRIRTIRNGRCVTRQATRSDGVSKTDTLVYVFNFSGNAGFSIIAANRAVSPLLVVTEQGNYDYGQPTGIEGFDNYMNSMIAELSDISKLPILDFPREYSKKEILKDDKIGPLCTTKWNQDGVFGAYCSNGVCGCTSIAAAQIMAYWEYPDTITTTYTDKNRQISSQKDHYGNFPDTDNQNALHIGETFAIPWSAIKNHNINCSSATCEQNHWIISALLRQIGELNDSVYYTHLTDESKNVTSTSRNSESALCKLGYIRSTIYLNFNWDKIRSELNDLRPMIIDSSSGSGGHTWVLDGYIDKHEKMTYYEVDYIDYIGNRAIPHYKVTSVIENIQQLVHFNWGWGGECDGYFTIENDITTTTGEKYDSNDTITHNITFIQDNIHLQGVSLP